MEPGKDAVRGQVLGVMGEGKLEPGKGRHESRNRWEVSGVRGKGVEGTGKG